MAFLVQPRRKRTNKRYGWNIHLWIDGEWHWEIFEPASRVHCPNDKGTAWSERRARNAVCRAIRQRRRVDEAFCSWQSASNTSRQVDERKYPSYGRGVR